MLFYTRLSDGDQADIASNKTGLLMRQKVAGTGLGRLDKDLGLPKVRTVPA